MQRGPENTDDRLARLEGQYHALSKEITDGFKAVNNTLNDMKKQVDEIHTVKSGLLKNEKIGDVIQRLDDKIDQMQKQVIAISDNLQIDRSKIK